MFKTAIYGAIATGLGAIAALSVMPASLIFVNNPKPPQHLLKK
ncbi:hypothetical protein PAECIP112173_00364 [Paenibacillus sp. JJ-100]|nr:cyclic lactone autoinducer peptide [Paenibacillus sp. JJ-100]CAI6023990.1 hypothetical protein PAECIP112173_00364 [Paenibacillus sp. JJ-100]